jgi:hypothetical protein
MKKVQIISLLMLTLFTLGTEKSLAQSVGSNENKAALVSQSFGVPAPRLITSERVENDVTHENGLIVPRPSIIRVYTSRSNAMADESAESDPSRGVPPPELVTTSDPHVSGSSPLSVPRPTLVGGVKTLGPAKSAAVLINSSAQ